MQIAERMVSSDRSVNLGRLPDDLQIDDVGSLDPVRVAALEENRLFPRGGQNPWVDPCAGSIASGVAEQAMPIHHHDGAIRQGAAFRADPDGGIAIGLRIDRLSDPALCRSEFCDTGRHRHDECASRNTWPPRCSCVVSRTGPSTMRDACSSSKAASP